MILPGTKQARSLAMLLGSILVTKFSSNTATQIVLKTPKRAAGTVDVRVVTAFGISAITSADVFQYQSPAVRTTLSPSRQVGCSRRLTRSGENDLSAQDQIRKLLRSDTPK